MSIDEPRGRRALILARASMATDRPTYALALTGGDPRPTDPRQSLRSVELLLPRPAYDRLEALRAAHAPALTLPDFLVRLLVPGADGFEAAMGDIDRAGRLVISP